ncbi:unnamed protein product, partial [Phaeothamnion confervicola]
YDDYSHPAYNAAYGAGYGGGAGGGGGSDSRYSMAPRPGPMAAYMSWQTRQQERRGTGTGTGSGFVPASLHQLPSSSGARGSRGGVGRREVRSVGVTTERGGMWLIDGISAGRPEPGSPISATETMFLPPLPAAPGSRGQQGLTAPHVPPPPPP